MDDQDFEVVIDDEDTKVNYDSKIGTQRNDVRRKIEEMLERKRLREEFGDVLDV